LSGEFRITFVTQNSTKTGKTISLTKPREEQKNYGTTTEIDISRDACPQTDGAV
jgi:hypothetical protein